MPSNTEDPKREENEHCKVINLRSAKDVHIPVGVPKRRDELFAAQWKTQITEEPQQCTFQSADLNNRAATLAENNDPAIVEEDVLVPDISV